MHPGTTRKIRIITIIVNLFVILFGVYLYWLAFEILEPTPFNLAALAFLIIASVFVLIWLFLITIKRTSFKTNLEDLKKYHVEHKIGIKSAHQKKF